MSRHQADGVTHQTKPVLPLEGQRARQRVSAERPHFHALRRLVVREREQSRVLAGQQSLRAAASSETAHRHGGGCVVQHRVARKRIHHVLKRQRKRLGRQLDVLFAQSKHSLEILEPAQITLDFLALHRALSESNNQRVSLKPVFARLEAVAPAILSTEQQMRDALSQMNAIQASAVQKML